MDHPDSTGPLARSQHGVLEFWFEFGSSYSYLAAIQVEARAQAAGVALHWRPFLLGPIFERLGWTTSPFVLQPAKGRYMWRDMEREAARLGLPFRRPSVFPRRALLPMRVATLGANEAWMAEFCRRVMRQNWVEDRDIDNEEAVRSALQGLVPDAGERIAAALEPANKLRLRANTDQAEARGIFGAPSFFAGGELFWGNDRLDAALAMAAGGA